MTKNIMIVGVGGQGSLLASKLLGHLLLTQAYDVKVSEVHGMSQRGGSVVTYVRFGEKVYSPIIDKGEADFIVSFEKLEAARWVEYLREGGRIVVNTQEQQNIPIILLKRWKPSGFRWMPWIACRWLSRPAPQKQSTSFSWDVCHAILIFLWIHGRKQSAPVYLQNSWN